MRNKFIINKPLIIIFALISIIVSSGCVCFAENYLTILHTNDVHGRLESFYYKDSKTLLGGIARRATLIKSIKDNNKYVLTVDSGDIAQGTLFFKFSNGIPDMDFMSDIGYDAAVPGNHEFDKGLDVFAQMTQAAKYPFICANLTFDNKSNIKISDYIIKDYGSFKVGIIGIITDNLKTKTLVNDGIKITDSVKRTKKVIQQIKNKVDLIVVLSHQGVEDDIRLAKAVPDINIIVGGHTHTFLTKPVIIHHGNKITLIVQAGEMGIFLGKIDLKFESKNIDSYGYKLLPIDENIKGDEYISGQVNELSTKIRTLSNEVVGTINFPINNNSPNYLSLAGLLANESIKQISPDADIIFQNNGGIRIKKYISPGNITKADILEIFPFDNKPVTAELKGHEIRSMLETSAASFPDIKDTFLQTKGIDYTVDLAGNPQIMSSDGTRILKKGSRVKNIFINGKPLEPDKYYKIVANNFLFNGGDGYIQLKKAKNIVYSNENIHDLIIKYIKNNSPLNLSIQDKINVMKKKCQYWYWYK